MGISELKQWRSRLSEDEIAQFLTTTESTKRSLFIPQLLPKNTLSFVRAPTTLVEEELVG